MNRAGRSEEIRQRLLGLARPVEMAGEQDSQIALCVGECHAQGVEGVLVGENVPRELASRRYAFGSTPASLALSMIV